MPAIVRFLRGDLDGDGVIERVEIVNFQSLRGAVVPLGWLTVITGPSSSGKSAFIRACRTLGLNARGTSYISSGQPSCQVTAGGEGWAVRITRSTGRGKNEYQTAVPSPDGIVSAKYSKLGGQVPPQVSSLLALSSLNFAGQFDPPFLLNVPGTELARTLGDLTNVSLVFSAASEASRRRKQAARDLEAARTRRDRLMSQAQEFAGLAGQRHAAVGAESALLRLQAASARLEHLRALAGRLRSAEAAAAAARAIAASAEPPSLASLDDLISRRGRLRDLAARLAAGERDAASAARDLRQSAEDEKTAVAALHDALVKAGHCPTCGSVVS